jgi:hypothetical protein
MRKAWATRKAKKAAGFTAEIRTQMEAQAKALNDDMAVYTYSDTSDYAPGRGEIVGGEVSRLADQIALQARKQGGTDNIQAMLDKVIEGAKNEGMNEQAAISTENAGKIIQRMEANIVCGFIAEFENTRDMTRVWTLNGYTLSKIIKALRKAGYNSVGKASEYD